MPLVGYIDHMRLGGGYLVGARDTKSDYEGLEGKVYVEGPWLMVVTDEYEGAAMLNVETLPFLIEALQKLKAVS